MPDRRDTELQSYVSLRAAIAKTTPFSDGGLTGYFSQATYNRGTQDWWSDLDYIAAAKTRTRNAYRGCLAQIARKVRATGAYLAAGERGQY